MEEIINMKTFLNILIGITFLALALYIVLVADDIVAKILGLLVFGAGAFRSFKAIGNKSQENN